MPSEPPKPLLVYLGPPGTYTHQAAFERFGDSVDYEPRETIKDIYTYLPPPSSSPRQILHLAPLENSKNGIVLETLDLLLQPSSSSRDDRLIVREELRTKVQHCLVVSRDHEGVEKGGLEGIEWVRSHEQALAQCQTFLSEHLPNAKRIPVTSTAHAAVSLLPSSHSSNSNGSGSGKGELKGRGAAICSRVVVDIYEGLECAREGVEDKKGNTTRFLLLSLSPLPSSLSRPSSSLPSPSPNPLSPSQLQLQPTSYLTMISYPSLPPSSLHTILSPSLVSLDRRPAQEAEDAALGDGGGFRSGWLAVYESDERYEGEGEEEEEGWWMDDEEEVRRVGGVWLGRWRKYQD